MKSIYNYNDNITVTKSVSGDVVITMNKEILTVLINRVADSAHNQMEKGLEASANDYYELFDVLCTKEEQAGL